MSTLVRNSPYAGETLGFFEEFRELSEGSSFAAPQLEGEYVEMTNPVCGDLVQVRVRLKQGRISSYGYQQKGCWPVAGCLELLGRLAMDAPLEQVLEFRLQDFLEMVRGIPASKRHAFSLAHRALVAAASQATGPGNSD